MRVKAQPSLHTLLAATQRQSGIRASLMENASPPIASPAKYGSLETVAACDVVYPNLAPRTKLPSAIAEAIAIIG